jgi:hypothetical protein
MSDLKSRLESHPVAVLKKEISKTNVKGYSKMKKAEVVSLMLKHKDRFNHIKHKSDSQKPAPKEKKPEPKEVPKEKKPIKFKVTKIEEPKEKKKDPAPKEKKKDPAPKEKRIVKNPFKLNPDEFYLRIKFKDNKTGDIKADNTLVMKAGNTAVIKAGKTIQAATKKFNDRRAERKEKPYKEMTLFKGDQPTKPIEYSA